MMGVIRMLATSDERGVSGVGRESLNRLSAQTPNSTSPLAQQTCAPSYFGQAHVWTLVVPCKEAHIECYCRSLGLASSLPSPNSASFTTAKRGCCRYNTSSAAPRVCWRCFEVRTSCPECCCGTAASNLGPSVCGVPCFDMLPLRTFRNFSGTSACRSKQDTVSNKREKRVMKDHDREEIRRLEKEESFQQKKNA